MKILLDTQIYLWFLGDSPKLSSKAKTHIIEAEDVFISAVSIWEAAIKIGLGRLEVSVDDLIHGIEACGFTELPITARQSATVAQLPFHHRDPFDRLLIAQALHEPLRLLTADVSLQPYSPLVELA
ncbi:MAG: type II toxin-antitoxin system VapC family toxin [Nitrospirales bacterium]